MHFAVIGAGNIGCIYGRNLSRAGEQVTMIDVWDEHVRQMQRNGLAMSGLQGDFVVEVDATTDPAAAAKADVALICVNSYNTRDAGMSASALLKESGYDLTLQNGLGNIEILGEILGNNRIMAGLTFHNADLSASGHHPPFNKFSPGSRLRSNTIDPQVPAIPRGQLTVTNPLFEPRLSTLDALCIIFRPIHRRGNGTGGVRQTHQLPEPRHRFRTSRTGRQT